MSLLHSLRLLPHNDWIVQSISDFDDLCLLEFYSATTAIMNELYCLHSFANRSLGDWTLRCQRIHFLLLLKLDSSWKYLLLRPYACGADFDLLFLAMLFCPKFYSQRDDFNGIGWFGTITDLFGEAMIFCGLYIEFEVEYWLWTLSWSAALLILVLEIVEKLVLTDITASGEVSCEKIGSEFRKTTFGGFWVCIGSAIGCWVVSVVFFLMRFCFFPILIENLLCVIPSDEIIFKL